MWTWLRQASLDQSCVLDSGLIHRTSQCSCTSNAPEHVLLKADRGVQEAMPGKASITSSVLLMAEACHTAEPKVSRARYIFCLLYYIAKSHAKGNKKSRQVIHLGTAFPLDHNYLPQHIKYIHLHPKTPQSLV